MSDRSPLLKDPWSLLSRQREAAQIGMWVFLGSEMLFFGALFLGYTFYRLQNPAATLVAAKETDIWFGTINTLVLLTSSYTMAMASQIGDRERDRRDLVLGCLAGTAALGILFLIIKGLEYKQDLDKLLLPGTTFALTAPP